MYVTEPCVLFLHVPVPMYPRLFVSKTFDSFRAFVKTIDCTFTAILNLNGENNPCFWAKRRHYISLSPFSLAISPFFKFHLNSFIKSQPYLLWFTSLPLFKDWLILIDWLIENKISPKSLREHVPLFSERTSLFVRAAGTRKLLSGGQFFLIKALIVLQCFCVVVSTGGTTLKIKLYIN